MGLRTGARKRGHGSPGFVRWVDLREEPPSGKADELDSTDRLEDCYRLCRDIVRSRSKTFYLSSLFLEPLKRRVVCAVYAFCRTGVRAMYAEAEPGIRLLASESRFTVRLALTCTAASSNASRSTTTTSSPATRTCRSARSSRCRSQRGSASRAESRRCRKIHPARVRVTPFRRHGRPLGEKCLEEHHVAPGRPSESCAVGNACDG
jgi:hypothetical protein